MDISERINRLNRAADGLRADYRQMEADYLLPLSEYLLPRRGYFSSRSDHAQKGRARGRKIINGVAGRAIRILAAGIMGGLTSPARQWFKLRLADERANKYYPVRMYLKTVEDEMYRVFRSSNFYSAVHVAYTELAGFGTQVLYVGNDPKTVLRFRPLTAGEYYIGEDHTGRVNQLYREFSMRPEQMIDKFGLKAVSDRVKTAAENKQDVSFVVCNMCGPRRKKDGQRKDALNMPFETLYWEKQGPTEQFLSEGGFEEFPYMASRWSVIGDEVYGRGPGHDVLPDTKMLQEMERSHLRAVNKLADPPIKRPSSMSSPVNALPGGVTPYDASSPAAFAPLYEVRPNTAELNEKIKQIEIAIKESFFVDVFLMNNYVKGMTATEVEERREEKLLMLGPVIERQTQELLNPLIDRTFGVLERKGRLPEPPREIQGVPIEVELISHMAQAQKLVSTRSIQNIWAFGSQIGGMDPEALDLLDTDETIREYAEASGVPANLIRGEQEVEQRRLKRQKALEAQKQQEQAMAAVQAGTQGAKAARDLSQVSPETISKLEEAVSAY